MENYKAGSLEIVVEKTGATTQLLWKGKSDERDPSALLDPYFDKVIDAVGGTNVKVDFTDLEYMNSSTLHPIIRLIKNLNGKKIETKLVYKADSKWQAASFKALKTFSSILPHVDIEGE